MNTHSPLSTHAFQEATKLATHGEEFSHLVKLMEPDHSLRLKAFVQSLPQSIAEKTIYGKTHWNNQSTAKKKR